MKPFDIVADESVDHNVVIILRDAGFTVYSITETNPSISDAAVLKIAVKNKSLLLTEDKDKDFGELVYRFNMKHCGILLIRLVEFNSVEKASLVLMAMEKHFHKLVNVFSVLDKKRIRTRK